MRRLSETTFTLACCLAGVFVAAPLFAQTTGLDRVAHAGGQVMAAARACHITAERIRSTSERLLLVLKDRAASADEKDTLARVFSAAQATRTSVQRGSRAQCAGVHVEFSELEVNLPRPPVSPAGLTKAIVVAR